MVNTVGVVGETPEFDWKAYFDEVVIWKLESGSVTLSDAKADLTVSKTSIEGGYQYVPTISATKTTNYMLSLQFNVPVEVLDKNDTSITYLDTKNNITFVYNYKDTVDTLPQYEKIVSKEGQWSISVANLKSGDVVKVDPSLVGLTEVYGSFYNIRQAFYYESLHWLFYSNSSDLVYRTSSDGVSWDAEITIRNNLKTGYGAFAFSIAFDGTRMCYALVDSSSKMCYRAGEPQADGTIDWIANEVEICTNNRYGIITAIDTSGYAWIGFSNNTSGYPYDLFITKSGNTDGTWGATPAGFPYKVGVGEYWTPQICSLTGGKVALTYVKFWGLPTNPVTTICWTGAGWTAEENSTSINANVYLSATAYDDVVHYVFKEDLTNELIYQNYTYGVGLGAETQVYSDIEGGYATISVDTSGDNDVYVIYTRDGDRVYYKCRISSVWQAEQQITNTVIAGYSISCSYQNYYGVIGYTYYVYDTGTYTQYYGFLEAEVTYSTTTSHSSTTTSDTTTRTTSSCVPTTYSSNTTTCTTSIYSTCISSICTLQLLTSKNTTTLLSTTTLVTSTTTGAETLIILEEVIVKKTETHSEYVYGTVCGGEVVNSSWSILIVPLILFAFIIGVIALRKK